MSDLAQRDILLQDPLSGVTRKERKMLLGVSILGVILVKTGLVPTRISALGVDFDKVNQQAMIGILAVIALYFLTAFVIYAVADFLAWRRAIRSYTIDRLSKLQKQISHQQIVKEEEMIWRRVRSSRILFVLSGPVSYVRAFFEFVLPVVVGIYSVLVLLKSVWHI